MADTDSSSRKSLLPSFRRTLQYGSSQPTPLHSLSGAIDVVLTEESHSELGAARDVLRHVWRDLQSGEIQLSSGHLQPSESQTSNLRKVMTASWSRVKRIGKAFLHNITDVAFSLLLSVIFVGIFVAESTGSIFSTNIVSNSMALLDPSACGIYMLDDRLQTFRRDVTAKSAMSYRDRCYIKDALTEGCDYFYISTLPYIEINNDKCPFEGQACLGDAMAYTMDTGLLDASNLGINTAKKLQFRRETTCTPLRTGSYIDPTVNCTDLAEKCRPRGIMSDGFQWGRNSLRGSDLRSIRPGDIFKMEISVRCARYSEPRDDPIFPASEPQTIDGAQWYISNVTQTTLTCVDTAQICDPISKLCQNPDISFRYGNINLPEIWPSNSSATEMERTLALSSYALYFSSTAEAATLARIEANPSHMAKEQWEVEARRWFEISLARMQIEVFELAQNEKANHNPSDPWSGYYVDVMPPQYRGICNMVKFRSNGWRNVSVWGLFGVLFLVMGICLGSIKNEKETLWLVVAIRSISLFICWLWGTARRVPWRRALSGIKGL